MTKHNWGIIGTGWIAHDMADALNRTNGEIYAAANPNEKHLTEFVREKNVRHAYVNPDDMIADENIDIIYVASPNNTHYGFVKKALEAGKNVFCEKSMTVNAKEFDELEALARKKGVILTEGFTLYHMPIYDKVKELIDSGRLGEIKLVQVNFGSLKDPDPTRRYFSRELAGGALLDIGCYATAFARMFLDEQPNSITTSVKFYETGVDEQSGIILKTPSEQMVVMALSFRAKQPKRGVISGTKGYVEISDYPRAEEAVVTYTEDAHTQTSEKIASGDTNRALEYEILDMQRYVEQGNDEGRLVWSRDVAHILDGVRSSWGMRFPFEK